MLNRIIVVISALSGLVTLTSDGPEACQQLRAWGLLIYDQGQVTLPFLLVYHQAFLALTFGCALLTIIISGWGIYCSETNREPPFILHPLSIGASSFLFFCLWILSVSVPVVIFVGTLTLGIAAFYFLLQFLRSYWLYYFTTERDKAFLNRST
jgi:hypothetical protein